MLKRQDELEVDYNRWAIPYVDLITLMLAVFVVLYASARLKSDDQSSLSELMTEEAMTEADGNATSGPQAHGLDQPNTIEEPLNNLPLKQSVSLVMRDELILKLISDLENHFPSFLKEEQIVLKQDDASISVELESSILFESGESQPSQFAVALIKQLCHFLSSFEAPIRVEGHTDNIPIFNRRFPSNWELSAARASAIVRLMVDEGVSPERLSAVGFGEHQPLYDNTTLEGRRKNRRVSIRVFR